MSTSYSEKLKVYRCLIISTVVDAAGTLYQSLTSTEEERTYFESCNKMRVLFAATVLLLIAGALACRHDNDDFVTDEGVIKVYCYDNNVCDGNPSRVRLIQYRCIRMLSSFMAIDYQKPKDMLSKGSRVMDASQLHGLLYLLSVSSHCSTLSLYLQTL